MRGNEKEEERHDLWNFPNKTSVQRIEFDTGKGLVCVDPLLVIENCFPRFQKQWLPFFLVFLSLNSVYA